MQAAAAAGVDSAEMSAAENSSAKASSADVVVVGRFMIGAPKGR